MEEGFSIDPGIISSMNCIPSGRFVMTAAHGGNRAGVLVDWVQQCAKEPPMVIVAIEKGQKLIPMIRDSKGFALCQIPENDCFLEKMFKDSGDGSEDDPFISIQVRQGRSGSPIVERALCYLDCEVVRHLDIESNYELYVGLIHEGSLLGGDSTQSSNGRSKKNRTDRSGGSKGTAA